MIKKLINKLLGIKSPSKESLKGLDSKTALIGFCDGLSKALQEDNSQKVAESIAKLHLGIMEFMESGYISYESVDSELMKLEVK